MEFWISYWIHPRTLHIMFKVFVVLANVCNIFSFLWPIYCKSNHCLGDFFSMNLNQNKSRFWIVHSSCMNIHMYTNPQSNAVIKSKCSLPVVWLLYRPLAVMKQKNIKYLVKASYYGRSLGTMNNVMKWVNWQWCFDWFWLWGILLKVMIVMNWQILTNLIESHVELLIIMNLTHLMNSKTW